MVSTEIPSTVRKRLNGITASLTAIGAEESSVVPSPVARNSPSARNCCTVAPSMMRAAALASGVAVALETKGTVREARGLASKTNRVSPAWANWMLIKPRTPTPRAIASVEQRIRSTTSAPSVIGGKAQAESPEWMPASSMCSMTPPR